MGNACCNYAGDKDKNDLRFGKKPEKLDPALDKILQEAKNNEDKIVKIQACYRGAAERKKIQADGKLPSSNRQDKNGN